MFCVEDSGIARGKHCKSLEKNIWRKIVLTFKNTILGRDQRFFASSLSEMDLGNVGTLKVCDKIYRFYEGLHVL